jgi:hypothetical protein
MTNISMTIEQTHPSVSRIVKFKIPTLQYPSKQAISDKLRLAIDTPARALLFL